MRRVFAAALLAAACSRGPQVPVNTLLWHVEEWRPASPNVRRAAAKFISFRAHGEFTEHVCYVIEQPDTSVYISRSDPHVIAIGKWTDQRPRIEATRDLVSRSTGHRAGTDPLCAASTFTISGNSVIDQKGVQFTPVTRLVAPDFESYYSDAQKTGTPCPQPPSK